MTDKSKTAEPQTPHRRWFQFRLRTMLIGMAALCILLAQSPLLVWEPPQYDIATTGANGAGGYYESVRTIKIADGYHFVPMRVVVVASIEAAALIGWIAWRRSRRPATRS